MHTVGNPDFGVYYTTPLLFGENGLLASGLQSADLYDEENKHTKTAKS